MRSKVLNDPQILLETWGGPVRLGAEYVFADMYGHDDELISEFMPLPNVPPVYHMPMMPRITLALREQTTYSPDFRTADYHLRSGWARAAVSAEHLPGWEYDPQVFLVRLLYVRYKRKI